MSDTVVIGIDSNLIPSDKKSRLKYASKYHNGSFRNSAKKNKPGINAGNLTFSEAFNIILQSGGKEKIKYSDVFDYKSDPEKTNRAYAKILQETGVALDIEDIIFYNKTGITEAEYEQMKAGWAEKHKSGQNQMQSFNSLLEEISITAVDEIYTEAADKKLEKIVFESQVYENFYKKAAYQSILKKTEKGLKAAGLYSLALSSYEVLNSKDKTKAILQEVGGSVTSGLVASGVVKVAGAFGVGMTGLPGIAVAGTALLVSAFAEDAAKDKIGELYDYAKENISIQTNNDVQTSMPYDPYHIFPGTKVKPQKSKNTASRIPYDMYHSGLNQTRNKNTVGKEQQEKYWIRETNDGLIVELPFTQEKVLLKKEKKPLLNLVKPPGMNNSNQSDKNVPVYRRNGAGNSKARKATKREQEEALKWGKFGMAMMMGFMPGPKVKLHANGGVVNGTTLSYVGEDGPEAIIPLGSKRRQRGMDLWNQAGAMLGVPVDRNKKKIYKSSKKVKKSADNDESSIKISVGNVSVNLKGSSENSGKNLDLLKLLKEQRGQISDELCSVIADALKGVYKNIPTAV